MKGWNIGGGHDLLMDPASQVKSEKVLTYLLTVYIQHIAGRHVTDFEDTSLESMHQ